MSDSTHSEVEPSLVSSSSRVITGPKYSNSSAPQSFPHLNELSNKSKTTFTQRVSSIFKYRKTSLSLLLMSSLLLTFCLNYTQTNINYLITLPTSKHETNLLDVGWFALQKISQKEHPYDSHANDGVHSFLSSKIQKLITQKNYIEFDNDLNYTNNFIFNRKDTFNSSSKFQSLIYYESNNLLVKIEGGDPKLPAILVSAHYDSVPTAFGTTDDGMGISSMIGVLAHFSHPDIKQPLRTIIFNFNNNEEFGLLGATAFFNHPYSDNVKYFINLEGTGAGGVAYLFRGTDYNIIKPYFNTRYPFGSSIFQQGFSSGLIHSETDYKVYTNNGLRGVDVAFIQPRDWYHTKHDSIDHTNKKSLWNMLSNTLDYVKDISETEYVDDTTQYSIFGNFLWCGFALPISNIYTINMILVVLSPIVHCILLLVVYKRNVWNLSASSIIRYPVSMVLSISVTLFISRILSGQNSLIPSLNYNIPLSTLISSFLLSNYVILNSWESFSPTHDFKLIILLFNSLGCWFLLLLSSVGIASDPARHIGEFVLGFVYLGLSVCSCIGLFGLSLKKSKAHGEYSPLLNAESENYGSHTDNSINSNSDDEEIEIEQPRQVRIEPLKDFKSYGYDWSLQFILLVPITILTFNYGSLILIGIHQTCQESLASTKFIWEALNYWSFLLAIPILPFILKFNRFFIFGLVACFLLGGWFNYSLHPFDQLNPLKLRFLEVIDLNVSQDPIVSVLGVKDFVRPVLEDIPSIKESGAVTTCTQLADGLEKCFYLGNPPNLVDDFSGDFNDLLDIKILINSTEFVSVGNEDRKAKFYKPLYNELFIKAPKNRNCVVTFNQSGSAESPVKSVIVYHNSTAESVLQKSEVSSLDSIRLDSLKIPEGYSKDAKGNDYFKLLKGIDEVQLHKLDWDTPYHIGFQWLPSMSDFGVPASFESDNDSEDNKLGVLLECYWGEHDTSVQRSSASLKVPDYDELVQYSPNFISWSNQAKGLVLIRKYVEI